MGPIELLTLPARLTVRALDDLHEVALVAGKVSRQIDTLLERADTVTELLLRLETLGGELTALAERIDGSAAHLLELGAQLEALGQNVLVQGGLIEQRAREVVVRGGQLLEALPALERAIALAEPLEGVVERVGRLADRLPGGSRRGAAPLPGDLA